LYIHNTQIKVGGEPTDTFCHMTVGNVSVGSVQSCINVNE